MAITWGSAVADATNAFRIGYEFSQSPTTVANGTTSVSVTEKIYLGTKYNAYDSGASWTISGSISASGSTSFNHTSGTAWSTSNQTLLATRTRTFAPSFSSTTVTSLTATVTGLAAIAGTASVSGSWTTAKRPVGVPAAPTGCTAARFSDTQQNISWTNTSPTSSSNPYVNVVVQRSTDGGSWATIATLGVVTSYQDKTTSANHHYSYRVYAKNGAGNSSTSSATAQLYTTPRAPDTPTATKNAAGNIVITWPNASSQASQVEVWHLANGVLDGAALATLTGDPLTYTHVGPNAAQTHAYQLRYKVPNPALSGPYSAVSNTVQLQAPPNAPSNLTPMVAALDATEDVTLGWQHNPVDTTPQTKYEIQYRVNGGAWTSTGQVTTATPSRLVAAGTWANGTTVEWQVRTWGAHATASPWSASVIYNMVARPTVSIDTPTAGTYAVSQGAMTWTYFDAAATPQQAYEAQLLDATNNVLETVSAAGAASSASFATPMADATTYTMRVRVQNNYGLWSAWDTVTVTVAYAKPPVPTLTAEWDRDTMAIALAIDNPPEVGGQAVADHNSVYRSIDGGPWVLVADNVPVDTAVVDPIPALAGTNTYKVVAFSLTPSSEESAPLAVDPPIAGSMALNAGPGFGVAVVLPYDPDVALSYNRDRVLHQFAGRDYAVPFVGDSLEETVSIGSSVGKDLVNSPTWDDVKFLCDAGAELACYRDPDGRRMFVSLGGPSFAGVTQRGRTKFTVQANRVAYTEGTPDQSGLTLAMGLYLDEDGVPYFDPTRRNIVALDADGQPYLVIGE